MQLECSAACNTVDACQPVHRGVHCVHSSQFIVLQQDHSTPSSTSSISSSSDQSDVSTSSAARQPQELLNHLKSLMQNKIVDCEEKLLQQFHSS